MTEEKKTNLKLKKIKRTFKGIVVSDKSDKTVVVKIDRVKMHSKYHKRYTVSKNFKAHDEKNEYKTGDKVIIQECRPLSKDKRWRVIGKFGHGFVAGDGIQDKELEELNNDTRKQVEAIERRVEESVKEKKEEKKEDKNEDTDKIESEVEKVETSD